MTSLEQARASGYVPLSSKLILEGRTGHPSYGTEVLALERVFSIGAISGSGDVPMRFAVMGAILMGQDPASSITSHSVPIVGSAAYWTARPSLDEGSSLQLLCRGPRHTDAAERAIAPRRQRSVSAVTPADELRSISGLPPGQLARFFGVSRTTFYKWLEGTTPRDARFQHLVEVLAHVKDAQSKLPPDVELGAWLRTPVAPGEAKPLDLLKDRNFALFRGLLIRMRSAGMNVRRPIPSRIVGRPTTRDERRRVLERISPSPRFETDSDPEQE